MRTEQLLRDTLTELADRPQPTDELYAAVLQRIHRGPARRRRRTALVLAVAALVVVLTIALPTLLDQRTVVPADQRVGGNWNLIHRVDLPPGWEVTDQVVTATSETVSIRTPVGASDTDFDWACTTTAYARGVINPNRLTPTERHPITVSGTPGFFHSGNFESALSSGAYWPYADDSYAVVDCGLGGLTRGGTHEQMSKSVEVAQWVRFAVSTTRLPFRLRSLPAGYAVHAVAPALSSATSTTSGAVLFSSAVGDQAVPSLTVTMNPGQTEVPEHIPGWETATIKGHPAVLSARDARLCLNLTDHTLCIQTDPREPADLTRSLWAAGQRELLVTTAESLTVARDLDRPETWFDANTALPR